MKTVKLLVSAIALSVMCIACSSNPLASGTEELCDAVQEKKKSDVIEKIYQIEVEKAQYDVLGVEAALQSAASMLTLDENVEIADYVKEEISSDYESVAEDYVDLATEYAEGLVEFNSSKSDKEKKKELNALKEKVDYLKNRLDNASIYLTEEVDLIVDKGDKVIELAEKYFESAKDALSQQ